MEIESNFIKTIMEEDIASGKHKEIITRFPPEPNAYLHIGHARAIITNFELAKAFGGKTNLRFDDTNPVKEDAEFVDAIIEDIKWLGYEPAQIGYGSDYFDDAYQRAILLIKKGLAYVDDLTPEEIKEYRGTLTEPGKNSPYRDRSVEENLKLFEEMKNGKYKDSEKTLRAKIDMSSPNINMRDPIIYRIIHIHHHHTGDKWCIYPMYDFAHPLQDAYEGVTHSLCSIEFENHRPLYNWCIENCETPHKPRQIEFGRLNITNTVLSKRYLKAFVDEGIVNGYDDPRMPTLCGLRRRGYTKDAIRNFILSTGLSKINSEVSPEMLDSYLRDDLKLKANRRMAVLDPLKVVIDNYPKDKIEHLTFDNNQENPELGKYDITFSNEIYIEREDFVLEKPNKHYKRLALGLEVRLMGAYFIKAESVEYDANGNICLVHATYDPATLSGSGFNERKPNGTIQYVDAKTCKEAIFNIYGPLLDENKDEELPYTERINDNSLIIKNGYVEMEYDGTPGIKYQLMRNGYYSNDYDSRDDKPIINLITTLKSSIK